MGLTYHKEPGGFLIALDDQPVGRLRWLRGTSDGLRYCDGGCRIVGVPWFSTRVFPTALKARLALADALVEEEMLEEG